METVIKKRVTNLNPKSVSILTQEFEVNLVTEKRIEMQTKTETQTRIEMQTQTQTETRTKIEMQTQTKTEIQIVDGEEVEVEVEIEVPVEVEYEVDVEVEVPVEVEFEAEVEVPVEVEVEVERETQIGSNHRRAYSNSASGREMLIANEPEDTVAEVMEVWGDEPTIKEPTFDEDYTPEPTLEERVSSIEATLANGGGSSGADVWDEMAVAIEEGVNQV